MKETFYFSHDYNTRSDQKIKQLIRKHWMQWYWLYWCIVEDLYQNANALQLDFSWIAYDFHIDEKIVESIISDFNLFVVKDGKFSSKSVWDRLQKRVKKSAVARENANIRWWKKDANALQKKCKPNALKESKVKENKGKEIKHKYWEYKNVLITDKQKEKFIKDFWKDVFDLYIKKLDEWIQMKWYKYKDHNLAMRKWKNGGDEKNKDKIDISSDDIIYDKI